MLANVRAKSSRDYCPRFRNANSHLGNAPQYSNASHKKNTVSTQNRRFTFSYDRTNGTSDEIFNCLLTLDIYVHGRGMRRGEEANQPAEQRKQHVFRKMAYRKRLPAAKFLRDKFSISNMKLWNLIGGMKMRAGLLTFWELLQKMPCVQKDMYGHETVGHVMKFCPISLRFRQ
ncbi:MAG: hypothetical protein ONB44_09180 [candidate division KSB1 bacterium]|nr:hypothetical protein [candidate division KSB1 bacterium]MDZ7302304.1 hypothetical protein [candidate division KSB1 bacterium]MDZ7311410.1 hypothetical protein [candidate division KSB1 bacterium]